MPNRSFQPTSHDDLRLAELIRKVSASIDISLVWVNSATRRFELANQPGLSLLGAADAGELAALAIPPPGVTPRDRQFGWVTAADVLHTAALVIAEPVVPPPERLPHMISVYEVEVDGSPGFAIVGLSVEEMHSTFRAIEASQALLWSFLDNIPAEIFVTDLDGRFTLVNRQLIDAIGRPREEVLGRTLSDLFASDMAVAIQRNDDEVLRSGRAMEFDEVFDGMKGRRMFRSIKFPIVRDEQVIAMGGVAMDVTERAQAESARALSEAQFRLAFEQANDGMATIDLDGTYLQVNQRLCDMLQSTEADIVGKRVEEFFHPENTLSFAATKGTVQTQGRAVFDKVLRRADGAAVYVRVSAALLRNDAGDDLHLIVSYADETERRAREASARQREKLEAVGKFASSVAHDINNLLSGVLGYSELVMGEVTTPEARAYCEQLIAATLRAADFTSRLLAFTGKGSSTTQPFEVKTIVTEVVDILRQSVPTGIEVVASVDTDHVTVMGDPSQIHGALLNLGLNARDAIQGQGTITYAATLADTPDAGPAVRISVTDTGVGIEPDSFVKVFEPFYTTKASGFGTGLGLPSVAAAARHHGGVVTVDSTVGAGSTFTIELPVQLPIDPPSTTE